MLLVRVPRAWKGHGDLQDAARRDRAVVPVVEERRQEVEVAESIQRTIRRNKLCVLAYNSCVDHIHLLLVCHAKRRDTLVGRLKAEATQRYKSKHHITAEFHLWAQKYDHRLIGSDDYLSNTIEYIRFNRRRHRLPANPGLRPVVSKMITRVEDVKDWLNGT